MAEFKPIVNICTRLRKRAGIKGGRKVGRDGGTTVRTVGQLRLQRPQHLVVSYRRRRLLAPPPSPKGTYQFTRSSKTHCKQLIKLLLKVGSVLTAAYPVKLYTPSIFCASLHTYLLLNKNALLTNFIANFIDHL